MSEDREERIDEGLTTSAETGILRRGAEEFGRDAVTKAMREQGVEATVLWLQDYFREADSASSEGTGDALNSIERILSSDPPDDEDD